MAKLHEFDPSLCNSKNILIFGNRDVGKTFLIHDLLVKNETCVELVFDPSCDEKYKEYTSNVIGDFDQNMHDKIITNAISSANENHKGVSKCTVFDCCMYDSIWIRNRTCQSLLENKNMTVIMALGYPFMLPNVVNSKIDYFFIFRQNILVCRKRLYEQYGACFGSFEIFCDVMDLISCQNHKCLVIHNTGTSNILEERVFLYKPDQISWKKMAEKKKTWLDNIREQQQHT